MKSVNKQHYLNFSKKKTEAAVVLFCMLRVKFIKDLSACTSRLLAAIVNKEKEMEQISKMKRLLSNPNILIVFLHVI